MRLLRAHVGLAVHGWSGLASLWLALTAGCLAPEAADGAVAPIVDGTSAAGVEDDAIVVVLAGGLCSGTLIGPRLVLTAKHCVVPEGAPGPVAPRLVRVGTGPSVTSLRATARVLEIVTTPGPLMISVAGADPVSTATGTDVAFLVLEEELPGVEPLPVRREAPESLVGTEVLAIGYGTTRLGGSGTRMRVTATMTGVTEFLVEAVEVVCQGDSGGPLLRVLPDGSREVVGVTSFGVFSGLVGTARGCPALRDYWNRVDLHLDLLDEARLRAGECVVLGNESCNSLDDDCDGTLDEGCAAVGEACSLDTDCAFAALPARFARDGGIAATCAAGVCVLPCDRHTPAESCAAVAHPYGGETALSGLVCAAAAGGGCTGECRVGAPGTGAFGASCAADLDCRSLVCAEGLCASPCVGDGLECAIDEVCTASAGVCGGCVAAATRPSGRARGEPCASAAECTSGLCGPDGYCSLACTNDRDCGAGMRCFAEVCTLGVRSDAGSTCELDTDCRRGLCGVRGGGRFCGEACSDADPCSATTVCAAGVCAPPLGVVGEACESGAACESGLCDDGLCTVPCGVGGGCPTRTRCERSAEDSFCRRPPPPVAGGCSAARGRRGETLVWAALWVLAVMRVRRRRALPRVARPRAA